MKQYWRIILPCLAALIVILSLLLLPWIRLSGESRFCRRVEAGLFCLEMERLNGTIEEPFLLKAGDSIDVSVVRISGDLSVSVGQENREPVYEGRNPDLGSFRVTVPEDGDYLISVSGKRAQGSISFQINRAAE